MAKEDNYKDYNEDSQESSGYNEAGMQISRLNDLWLLAERHARRGNFKSWVWVLDSIYRELITDIMKMKDHKNLIKKNTQFLKILNEAKGRTQIYLILDRRHQFLKLIQEDSGKGSKYVESDTEAFE